MRRACRSPGVAQGDQRPGRGPAGAAAFIFCGAALAGAWPGHGHAALRSELLDDFRDAAPWQASASDQVRATLRRDGDGSLCLDYDFAGVSGYAVMRRALPVDWPQRFDLNARLKSRGAVNDFQFKLVDAGGDNVWWLNRPNAELPAAPADFRIRGRQIEFAWGPATERALRRTQFVEFVVAAGRDGGAGSLCVARLVLAERAPDPATWPTPHVAARDGGIEVDFGAPREFNGLALRWPATMRGLDYDVEGDDGGGHWRLLRRVRGSDGGLDALFLPDSEARRLRVRPLRGGRVGDVGRAVGSRMPQVELRSAAEWPTANAIIATLAADAPRGDLPRAFRGEQNYWTLVGVDGGGGRSALISEDGAVEVGRGGFSIEPSLQVEGGAPVTWAQARITQSLRDGYLPIPAVQWTQGDVALAIEAAADGPRDAPQLLVRYRLRNTGKQPRRLTLVLALRPWQVNPPQQFLATQGGVSAVAGLRWDGRALLVDKSTRRPQAAGKAAAPADPQRLWPTPLRFTETPQRVTALPFDGGIQLATLLGAPALRALTDPQARASAALQFSVTLAPGAEHTLGWTAPLGGRDGRADAPSTTELDARIDAAAAQWRTRLNRVALTLPAEAGLIADTLRASLAHMLMSRDGAALRPGTRSYARTWIRDGAMMVAALLRLGEIDAARAFVDWYAERVFESGKVPCCVDARGADPVVENDSHGEFLYAVAEVWRHTGDREFLQRHWPRVQRVAGWLDALRCSERSDANRTPQRARLYGLLPPSISHEGYSDKPAYAYWDDFWGLRGLKDAVQIAQALGQSAQAAAWSAVRDEFDRDLQASIAATAAHYGLATIAGAADRGDFDATSTTIALDPAQAALPPGLLAATFERYWQEASARSDGRRARVDYTPYELRTVGALTRLGLAERAHALLAFFFRDQRPAGWKQWAEVVLPDPRQPRFLGDMPHAWVSSDYIRSALDFFGYERESDGALLIGAGLQPGWLARGAVGVRGLSTRWGTLAWQLSPSTVGTPAAGWTLEIGAPRPAPPGGIRLLWPGSGALPRATADGRELAWQGRELPLPAAAAVQLRMEPR